MTRRYHMTHRSKQAEQTTANIITAAELLLANTSFDQVTLRAIAKEAGTTVQTVIRKMGSREGCFKAVIQALILRVEKQRGNSTLKDIDTAISELVDHYESEGKLILNFLAQERRGNPFILNLMQGGRAYHRTWVENSFSNYLNEKNQATIDALVVATDIFAWKLLCLDMGRSKDVAKEIITTIVKKILEVS